MQFLFLNLRRMKRQRLRTIGDVLLKLPGIQSDFLAPVISTFGHMPPDNPARLSRPPRNSRNDRKPLQPDKMGTIVLPPFSFAVPSNVTSSSIVKRCFTVCPCVPLTSSSLATQSDATYEQSFFRFLSFFLSFFFSLLFSSSLRVASIIPPLSNFLPSPN